MPPALFFFLKIALAIQSLEKATFKMAHIVPRFI